MLWCYSKVIFFYSLLLVKFQIDLAEDFLWLTVAISRGMTLMELQNIWNYKHCFNVKTGSEESSKNYFEHKYYSLWAQIKNLTLFLLGKNVIGGEKKNQGAKLLKGKY